MTTVVVVVAVVVVVMVWRWCNSLVIALVVEVVITVALVAVTIKPMVKRGRSVRLDRRVLVSVHSDTFLAISA